MKYPKVIFKPMSLKRNIEQVKWAYNLDGDLMSPHYYTLQYFPELENIPKKELNNEIEKVVSDRYNRKLDVIKAEVERYNNLWGSYNNKYIETLCRYLNTTFSADIIKVRVGLMPVNPRDVHDNSFDVDINISDEQMIDTCAHEICHFVWFNKWKELYPDCKEEEYDDGIVWKYSEIVVDPILNSKEINDILNINCRAYDVFYEMTDNDQLVIENLRNIYNTNDSIENKIIDGYNYIKNVFSNK